MMLEAVWENKKARCLFPTKRVKNLLFMRHLERIGLSSRLRYLLGGAVCYKLNSHTFFHWDGLLDLTILCHRTPGIRFLHNYHIEHCRLDNFYLLEYSFLLFTSKELIVEFNK